MANAPPDASFLIRRKPVHSPPEAPDQPNSYLPHQSAQTIDHTQLSCYEPQEPALLGFHDLTPPSNHISVEPESDQTTTVILQNPDYPTLTTAETHALTEFGPVSDHQDGTSRKSSIRELGAEKHVGVNALKLWNPIWLHWMTLCGLVIIFIMLGLTVIILYVVSERNHGLSTQKSSNHYSWTYGPTALLVIVVAIWRQVDHYCKMLTPWKELRAGESAKKTVLLDYTSPVLPSCLRTSARNRHWAVLSTMLGSLLLRIAIVFSTGLIVLTPTTMTKQNLNVIGNSMFSAADVGASVVKGGPTHFATSTILKYYAIVVEGLEYPYGTADGVAYDTIDLTNIRDLFPNSTISAEVKAFYPKIICEPAQLVQELTTCDDSAAVHILELESKACQPSYNSSWSPGYITVPDPPNGTDLGHAIHAGVQSIDCQDQNAAPSTYDRHRLLTITKFKYDRDTSLSPNPLQSNGCNSTEWRISIAKQTAIVCEIRYSIETANIEIDVAQLNATQSVRVSAPLTGTERILEPYDFYSFAWDIDGTMLDAWEISVPAAEDLTDINEGGIQLFSLMLLQSKSNNMSIFFNETIMSSLASTVYGNVGVQIASSVLRHEARTDLPVTVKFPEQRLQVHLVNVCIMTAVFGILALLTIVVLAFRPIDVVPQRPHTAARLAAILSSSTDTSATLIQQGQSSDSILQARLADLQFQSLTSTGPGAPMLAVVPNRGMNRAVSQEDNDRNSKEPLKWWRPFAVSRIFMFLAVAAPIISVVILEVLQRKSDSNQGFVNVATSQSLAEILISTLSAFVMVLVGFLFDAGDFAVSTFTPYCSLRKGSTTAKRSILKAYAGQLPGTVILSALQAAHFAVALAAIAALLSSFLTIIVSGLYTVVPIPQSIPATYCVTDKFEHKWNSVAGDNNAALTLTLLEYQNASYPSNTHDEIAIPAVILSPSTGPVVQPPRNGSLGMTLPATRADLNCSLIPSENITIWYSYGSTENSVGATVEAFPIYVFVKAGLIAGCHSKPSSGRRFNYSSSAWTPSTGFDTSYGPDSIGFSLTTYGGMDVATEAFPDIVPKKFGVYGGGMIDLDLGRTDNPPECPSIAFMYGYFLYNRTALSNITVYTCSQSLQEVQTDITFNLPEMTLDPENPPVVHESSAKVVAATDYQIVTPLSANLATDSDYDEWNYTSVHLYNDEPMDGFMQTLVFGVGSIRPEELVGAGNAEQLLYSTRRMYRRYMAQVLNANMRQKLTPSDVTPALNATVTNPYRLRVQQNRESKLVLQVLLGTILLLGIAAYALTDMRRILPHSPHSIAGVMSLLAGSELCTRKVLPAGAEFMDDRELARALDGYLFSIGWWGEGKNEERRFGIDVGRAAKEE